MAAKQVQLIIENEVSCQFVGLDRDHLNLFVQAYASYAPNYFFHPLYKLGTWDGKIRFFTWNGQTYNTLIPEILPAVGKLGYKVTVQDNRAAAFFKPAPVTEDYFSHINNPETNEPIMLRDYQVRFANTLMEAGNGIGVAATSAGKAQPLDAKVMTPCGWKRMGDILVGDLVKAADGTNATVTGVFPQGIKEIYKVSFHDGTSTECCKEHLWGVYAPIKSHTGKTEYRVMALEDIISFLERKESGIHTPGCISVPVAAPIEWDNPTTWLIPPYSMGALLGDGCMSQPNKILLTSSDSHIVNRVKSEIIAFGVSLKHRSGYDYGITKDTKRTFPPAPNQLIETMKAYKLMGCSSNGKFIPSEYKQASVADRYSIVQGLMDTDGTVDRRGNVSFSTVSYQLACDLREIIQSIGGICTITSRRSTFSHLGERRDGQLCYQLNISHPNKAMLFSLPRKVDRCRTKQSLNRTIKKRIVSVELVGQKEAQCIMIDHPNHLYITDDYIVTHNTFICGSIVEAYRRVGARSIIIVPSNDLIRQTRKELAFLEIPTGEYSGKVKDTNGHDIIISTWQALKNNPSVVVDRDVVLVDETHGARGNVLQELLTKHAKNIPHRFGVTGTMPEHPSEALSVRCAIGEVLDTIDAALLIEKGVLATIDIGVFQMMENLMPQYREYLKAYEGVEEAQDELVDYKTFKAKFFPDYSSEKKYLAKKPERLDWISATIDSRRNNGNVLALVQSVEMGKKLAEITPNSKFVYGNDDDKVREEAYSLFAQNDGIVVFATYGIASTGLSIKRIHELFLIDIGKSFIRVIQSIGRGLRKAPDKQHINVWDICSDLTYSKKHLTKRKAMYKTAGYPFKVKKVDYNPEPSYDELIDSK